MRTARFLIARILVALVALGCLALQNLPVDPLPPGIQTPGYAPGPVGFGPGQQLFYTVTWEELPVAFAKISLRDDPKRPQDWVGEALVSTNKLVDVLYRMRAFLREEFAAKSLASDDVFIHHNDNGRISDYAVIFDRTRGLVETTRRKHDHAEVKRFLASHPLGPIGGCLLALSQPMKIGGSMTLDLFAASERYVINFRVTKREQIHMGPDDIDAFRVVPSVLYVSNPKNHYKVTQAVVWVSADRRHVPLRIEADTFVGRIYVDLVRPHSTAPAA